MKGNFHKLLKTLRDKHGKYDWEEHHNMTIANLEKSFGGTWKAFGDSLYCKTYKKIKD